ncbi:hypothetical protein [Streptomyces erythrochromogenes]|uniref:hypothetical protein n=1 Tax=Streptomyces erythrochromogenes TaxID=285574 RepID=UPI0038677322|nr:hypothetical protein OG364_03590 [Streptomyces erythrochromogenes]
MRLTFDGDWTATVEGDPLSITPRFTGDAVDLAHHANMKERSRFFASTFGSRHWLWDTPDILRFSPDSRQVVGAEFQMPYVSAASESSTRVPHLPAPRPGGLRADEVRSLRHETCTVLCRVPGDGVLTCLRDLEVLDEPLDARIGIAPDVALLVQKGAVVGWTLTDPVQYLTTAFAAPDPDPPSSGTRRLFTECLDLVTDPLVDDLVDGVPAARARLRAADEALREQRVDRRRAAALRELISTMVKDYGDR